MLSSVIKHTYEKFDKKKTWFEYTVNVVIFAGGNFAEMLPWPFTLSQFSRYYSYFLNKVIWDLFSREGIFREEDNIAINAKVTQTRNTPRIQNSKSKHKNDNDSMWIPVDYFVVVPAPRLETAPSARVNVTNDVNLIITLIQSIQNLFRNIMLIHFTIIFHQISIWWLSTNVWKLLRDAFFKSIFTFRIIPFSKINCNSIMRYLFIIVLCWLQGLNQPL